MQQCDQNMQLNNVRFLPVTATSLFSIAWGYITGGETSGIEISLMAASIEMHCVV